MNLGFEHEAFGVHQDMALTSFDLLASYSISVLFSAHRGSLDQLRIHHPGTGLRISPQADPKALADSLVDPLPGAIDPPLSEIVVIDGGPSREVVRK